MSVPRLLRLADGDNVYVATGNLRAGTQVPSDSELVLVREDIELGHKVIIAAHLANMSYRTGKRMAWDAEKQQVIG